MDITKLLIYNYYTINSKSTIRSFSVYVSIKKRYILIIFISWLAYLISYLGRNDYSASILEIVNK